MPRNAWVGIALAMMDSSVLTSSTPVVRITPPSERRTSRYLTKYEVAKVVGERAKQIAAGTRYTTQRHKRKGVREWGLGSSGHGTSDTGGDAASRRGGVVPPMTPDSMFAQLAASESVVPPLAGVKATMAGSDPVRIAMLELVHKRIPFILRREFPDGHCEDIPLKDLEVDTALLDL
jgi:DNA-directed RNA polymerase subunit K/omega